MNPKDLSPRPVDSFMLIFVNSRKKKNIYNLGVLSLWRAAIIVQLHNYKKIRQENSRKIVEQGIYNRLVLTCVRYRTMLEAFIVRG